MKIALDIDDDCINAIVKKDLNEVLSSLRMSMKRIKKEKRGFVFSVDYDEDVFKVGRMINALKMVVEYYGS